jgi:hypothetical protein
VRRINRIALRNFGDVPNDKGDSTYGSFSQEVLGYLDRSY